MSLINKTVVFDKKYILDYILYNIDTDTGIIVDKINIQLFEKQLSSYVEPKSYNSDVYLIQILTKDKEKILILRPKGIISIFN
jgi:hypothetical protein